MKPGHCRNWARRLLRLNLAIAGRQRHDDRSARLDRLSHKLADRGGSGRERIEMFKRLLMRLFLKCFGHVGTRLIPSRYALLELFGHVALGPWLCH